MVASRGEARQSDPWGTRARRSTLALLVAAITAALGASTALAVPGDFTPAPTSPVPAGDGPTSIVADDLNGDARADLAVANGYSDDVTILLGDGSGTFAPAPTSPEPVGDGPTSIVTGNLNGDTNPDLAVANGGSDDVTILLGDGSGNFTPAPSSPEPVGNGPTSITTGFFGDDSATAPVDLAVANGYSDNVSILLGDGGGDFTPAPTSPEPVGVYPTSVEATYLLTESHADLVVSNGGSDTVSVLLGADGGDFHTAPSSPEAVGDEPSSIAAICGSIGDCSTGRRTLYITNGGGDSVDVLAGNYGDTDFDSPWPPLSVGVAPTSLASISQYTESGWTVAVANGGSDDVSILNFDAPIPTSPEAVGSHPTSIVTGNLNGDATFGDLAVANGGSDNVSILLNNVPTPQVQLRDRLKLKRCIKQAKKRHRDHPGRKKTAIKRCKRKFG